MVDHNRLRAGGERYLQKHPGLLRQPENAVGPWPAGLEDTKALDCLAKWMNAGVD